WRGARRRRAGLVVGPRAGPAIGAGAGTPLREVGTMPMMITMARLPAWSADVVVDADPITPVRDVVKNLLDSLDPSMAPAGDDLAVTPVYLGARPLDLSLPLAGSGIHDGTVLWLGQPGPVSHSSVGLVTVRAVAGARAGRVWYLGAGEHRIGSGASCRVTIGGDLPEGVAIARVSLDATVHVRAVAPPALLNRAPLPDPHLPRPGAAPPPGGGP